MKLQIDSLAIAYQQSEGMGQPVVLVHGNSLSGRAYAPQLSGKAGKKYRLIALDLPGHGQSDNAQLPQQVYSLPGYADIIVSVVQKLGVMDAVFVGWSLGGHILLEASAQLPNAKGFVIFGTPAVGKPPAMDKAFLPHPSMAATFKGELSEEEMAGYVKAFFRPGVEDIPESFIKDVHRTDTNVRRYLGESLGAGNFADEVEIVKNLPVPLAILHGVQEQLVNGDYFDSLSIPTLWRGQVQIIQNAGHAPQWEQPEQFNNLLDAFVAEVSQ